MPLCDLVLALLFLHRLDGILYGKHQVRTAYGHVRLKLLGRLAGSRCANSTAAVRGSVGLDARRCGPER
jgi:hypothetical protein